MKETTVQIDGMMSIFDDAGVEKQIKRRDGVVRVDISYIHSRSDTTDGSRWSIEVQPTREVIPARQNTTDGSRWMV